MASELVTNSLVHGAKAIEVDLSCSERERCDQIEVSDQGKAPVRTLALGTEMFHGRGLQIAALLANRWGTFTKEGDGNTVWAQVLV